MNYHSGKFSSGAFEESFKMSSAELRVRQKCSLLEALVFVVLLLFLIALLYVLENCQKIKISRSNILHPPQSIVSESSFLSARGAG